LQQVCWTDAALAHLEEDGDQLTKQEHMSTPGKENIPWDSLLSS
jgi:hypothetical protein